MNTREEMLARMRRSQPAPVALPELPAFAQGGGCLLYTSRGRS